MHYPTDISLLFDATRKLVELSARLSADQAERLAPARLQRQAPQRNLRAAQSTKHRTARSEAQKEKNDARVIEAHKAYLEVAQGYLDKARQTLARTAGGGIESLAAKIEIETFIKHAERQIDQTRRRVILGEVIPHAEKVFSVFETHTEWISKGKAGVPVNWVCGCASWKTSIASCCIIGSWKSRPMTR